MSKRTPEPLASPELELLGPMLDQHSYGWSASFQGLTLRTALQPIFSISHKRVVGYEALIRAFDTDDSRVLPLHLFQLPADEPENLLLDRLCRYLHIQNYSSLSDQVNWLFLNVSPQVVASGRQSDAFFGQLLKLTGLPPHRVVIEIVEQPTDDSDRLRKAVAYYQQLGCLTAIDDFGAGHSNFERIWNLSPDIVKLDRMLLTRATEDKKARQILNGIVSLLHQSACLVLLEGVETRDQAMIAIDAGVDFVQGFYFCRPSLDLADIGQNTPSFEDLLTEYKSRDRGQLDPTQQITDFFRDYFQAAVNGLVAGGDIRHACEALLAHQTVSRCYLLDALGVQIENTQTSHATAAEPDPRFRPLENTQSADWYRQHYLKQALAHPDQIQVTSPYLSVTGAYMCVTLSLAYTQAEEIKVLCCDILTH
ncbi:MAG: EAL domain-containing protein [Oleiphilaceae bacterium]|nr:EAL domain-containing protein [Oleiphilaceae bacterium]